MKERALLLGKLKGTPSGEDAFSPHGGKALQFYLKNVTTFIFCCMSEKVPVVSEKFISFLRAELHSCTSAHKNSPIERARAIIKKPALVASSSTTTTKNPPANKKNTPLKSLSNPPAKKQKIPAHDNEEYYYPLGEFSSYLYETEDHKKPHHPSANKQKNKPYSASHETKKHAKISALSCCLFEKEDNKEQEEKIPFLDAFETLETLEIAFISKTPDFLLKPKAEFKAATDALIKATEILDAMKIQNAWAINVDALNNNCSGVFMSRHVSSKNKMSEIEKKAAFERQKKMSEKTNTPEIA